MNVDLARITARVTKVQSDCTSPESDFYRHTEFRKEEIARIDTAIKNFIQKHPFADNLWSSWEAFKKEIPDLIAIGQKIQEVTTPHLEEDDEVAVSVRSFSIESSEEAFVDSALNQLEASALADSPMQQSVQSLKSIWNTYKETQQDIGLLRQIKDLVACTARPLQLEIFAVKNALSPSEEEQVPAQNDEDPNLSAALEAAQISYDEELETRNALEKTLLSQNKPNLHKTITSFARSLSDGEYGEKIKKAFLESEPSVINSASFFKFLLIEKSRKLHMTHTFHELEWDISESQQEEINQICAELAIGSLTIEEIEQIFLEEDVSTIPMSAMLISHKLTDAVKSIKITRSDEQVHVRLLHDALDASEKASDLYEKVLEHVKTLSSPFERANFLADQILVLKIANQKMFFKVVDIFILDMQQLEESHYRELLNKVAGCLFEVLEDTPISAHFSQNSEFWKFSMEQVKQPMNPFLKNRLLILQIPTLLSTQRALALEMVREVLSFAKSEKDFVIPVELFHALIKSTPSRSKIKNLMLEVVKYVPVKDRSECFVMLAHLAKEDRALAETLARKALECAAVDTTNMLKEYLFEGTPEKALHVKAKIKQLFRYLHAELKEINPKINHEHLELNLFLQCIEKERDREFQIAFRALLISEFIQIGEKETALRLAKEALSLIRPEEKNDLIALVIDAFLKASGIQDDELDSRLFGTLCQEERSGENALLDPDFQKLFLQGMLSLPISRDLVKGLVDSCLFLDAKSYKDFSLQVGSCALEAIRKLKTIPSNNPIEDQVVQINSLYKLVCQSNTALAIQAKKDLTQARLDLFDLEMENLATIVDPLAQIERRCLLIIEFINIDQGRQSLKLARETLRLLRPEDRIIPGPLGNYLNALEAVIIGLHRAESVESFTETKKTECKELELNFIELYFEVISFRSEPRSRIDRFIQASKKFKSAQNEESSLAAATLALEEIKNLSISPSEDLIVDKELQIELLELLIVEMETIAPSIAFQSRDALEQIRLDLFNLEKETLKDLSDPLLQEEEARLSATVDDLKQNISSLEKLIARVKEEKRLLTKKHSKHYIDGLENQLQGFKKKLKRIECELKFLQPQTQIQLRISLIPKLIQRGQKEQLPKLIEEVIFLFGTEDGFLESLMTILGSVLRSPLEDLNNMRKSDSLSELEKEQAEFLLSEITRKFFKLCMQIKDPKNRIERVIYGAKQVFIKYGFIEMSLETGMLALEQIKLLDSSSLDFAARKQIQVECLQLLTTELETVAPTIVLEAQQELLKLQSSLDL